jgi:hypothetical protein
LHWVLRKIQQCKTQESSDDLNGRADLNERGPRSRVSIGSAEAGLLGPYANASTLDNLKAVGRTADDATCNAVALDEWRLSRHRLRLGNKHRAAQTTDVSLTMPLVAALYNNFTTMRSVFITILQQLS